MEQIVRVKETYSDGTALVVHIRQSACSGDCHKCSGCGAAQETVEFHAQNLIGAERGALVTVSTASGPVLAAAAVLYMMPLALFLLGYGAAAALNLPGAAGGGLGFLLGILLAVSYDRRRGKKKTEYTITGYAEAF